MEYWNGIWEVSVSIKIMTNMFSIRTKIQFFNADSWKPLMHLRSFKASKLSEKYLYNSKRKKRKIESNKENNKVKYRKNRKRFVHEYIKQAFRK